MDDHRLRWRFTESYDPLTMLAHTGQAAVPAHRLEGVDLAAVKAHELNTGIPVASGPWTVAARERDVRLVLAPNDAAPPEQRPRLDRVVFKTIPDYATRLVELENGTVDMVEGVQVAEPAAYHLGLSREAARERAARLLEEVGLAADLAGRFPGELSGGQRQRAAIALALAAEPRVLIADEATTALDVTTQAHVIELLRRLARERGLALVLVSHDLGLVAAVADEVAVMERGAIVERGPPAQVLATPAHEHTRALVACRLRVDGPGLGRPPLGPPILEAEDVVAEHRAPGGSWSRAARVRAVDGASLAVHPGRTLALVGESGSGKSTLARVLLRLHPAASGRVRFRGEDWLALSGGALRRARRERRERVAALLADVALDPALLDRLPGELSGGQRQRVCIARGLATEPTCMVLDEPVSALDAAVQARVLELLRRIQAERGVGYLFITHDLAAARAMADTLAVMKSGRIVEAGAADPVFAAPAHPYTRELLAAAGRYSTSVSA